MESPEMMREITRGSMDFSKAQLDQFASAYRAGTKVEFESFSPYVADHDLAHGDIQTGGLTNEERIGLEIAKVLRELLPEARMISLYDEYNTNMPDAELANGRPIEGKQISLPEDVRENFKTTIQKLLGEEGIAREDDLLISESSKAEAASELTEKLRDKGLVTERDGALYFQNPNPENPDYAEVLLRNKSGRWMCEALDASTRSGRAHV